MGRKVRISLVDPPICSFKLAVSLFLEAAYRSGASSIPQDRSKALSGRARSGGMSALGVKRLMSYLGKHTRDAGDLLGVCSYDHGRELSLDETSDFRC